MVNISGKLLILTLLFLLIISSLFAENKPTDRWLSKDKAAHFSTSVFLTYWQYNFYHQPLQMKKSQSIYLSVSITGLLGLLKEVRDSRQKNNYFSYKDLIYDILGCGFGYLIISK
ncbi:MAG: hypothetical protein DRH57_03870 [Candidatus Cloacimonadota bacterium]|nr:MAG: hypothetical protein DRH57_03870 [Candidatus Cloacimonadota bacterium]